jgi:hypothetical protein
MNTYPSDSIPTPALMQALPLVALRCPGCDYDIRAISTATCPECGMSLVLTVAAANKPKRTSCIELTLVVLGAIFGFHSSWILYAFTRAAVSGMRIASASFWIYHSTGLCLAVVIGFIFYRRSRLHRHARSRPWLIAIAVFAFVAALDVILFTVFV